MRKRIISFVIALFLMATCFVMPVQVKAAGGSIDFDDLINAGAKIPEITLTADKETAVPGDVITVTVSVTGGELEFTQIEFVPFGNSAYEVLEGSLIGIGLEGNSGSFDKTEGGKVVFSTSAIRTGDVFRYTVKIRENASSVISLDGEVILKDGTVELPCLLVDALVTVSGAHTHSFTNYVSDNNATYDADGTKTAKCDFCNETKTIPDVGSKLIRNGWFQLGGKWYYYKNDVKQTGWLQLGSTWYYLDANGVMVTGEYKIGNVTHKFDDDGKWLGEVHTHSFTNYVSDGNATCTADGTKTAKCDGCDETDTVADVGSKLGHSFTNYVSDNNATYDADGTKTAKCDRCDETDTVTDEGSKLKSKNGWFAEGGKWYYYKNNVKQTGWVLVGNTWYYMNSDGSMKTGWLQEGSKWYYLSSSGAMVTGEYKIGNVTHKFNGSGVWLGEVQQIAKNGWVLDGGKWYYYQNGTKKTGWLQEGSTWYYLDANGVMVTGEYKIGNVTHKFNGSGVWLGEVQSGKNGWVQDGGKWYYYQNGTMVKGWKAVGGVWYYMKADGTMATGWIQVGSTWYYMNASGAMKTGWLKLGNTWYYLKSDGAMATGSLKIGTKTYQFNSSGACLNP